MRLGTLALSRIVIKISVGNLGQTMTTPEAPKPAAPAPKPEYVTDTMGIERDPDAFKRSDSSYDRGLS